MTSRFFLRRYFNLIGPNEIPNDEEIILSDQTGIEIKLIRNSSNTLNNLATKNAIGAVIASRLFGTSSQISNDEDEIFQNAFNMYCQKSKYYSVIMEISTWSENGDILTNSKSSIAGHRYTIGRDTDAILEKKSDSGLGIAIALLFLSIPERIKISHRNIGEYYSIQETNSTEEIYAIIPRFSVSATQSFKMEKDILQNTRSLSLALSSTQLETAFRLIAASAEIPQDPTLSFLAAWTAFEVFINKVFNFHLNIHKMNFPETHEPSVLNTQVLNKSGYSLARKFRIIAENLANSDANTDLSAFLKIKEQRNNFAHEMKINNEANLTNSMQDLLRKYINLHVNMTNDGAE